MNIKRWQRRVNRTVKRQGTKVTIQWVETGPGTEDPVTGATSGAVVQKAEDIKAFVHFAEPKSELRQYEEIAVGDAILDLPVGIDLRGRQDLVFVIDGQEYEQKRISDKLAQAWDAYQGGHGIMRTLLLRLKA
jgi:hypothetical protein